MPSKPPYTIPEVLRLKSEGLTRLQIADRFGISSSRIGQIIKREQQQALSAERCATIRSEIRVRNDIGRKLPIDDLFGVMNFSGRATTVLSAYFFKRQGITELSLRDMMDFLIPIVEHSKDHDNLYDHMPACLVSGLGPILYATMIKGLSVIDAGEVFRAEWTERKKSLREYLIRMGGFYPHILQGERAALTDVRRSQRSHLSSPQSAATASPATPNIPTI